MYLQPQLTSYAQEFSYTANAKPSQPKPSSAYRRNNPHPRPDFLLPRKPQTGYGYKPRFQMVAPQNNAPLFPQVRHISVQCPDGNVARTQLSSHSNTAVESPVAVGTMPPAVCLPELQTIYRIKDQQSQAQSRTCRELSHTSKEPLGSPLKHQDHISPLKPSKPQLTRKHSLPSGGYSCFHVVKPFKAGCYVIHPEFMSEWLH